MLRKLLLEHPEAIGETYAQHASQASWIGLRLIGAGLACLIHAVVPGLCIRTASRTIESISELMHKRAHSRDGSPRIEQVPG